MAQTKAQRKAGHLTRKVSYTRATAIAAAKNGQNYSVVKDKTGTMIKGNNIFTCRNYYNFEID